MIKKEKKTRKKRQEKKRKKERKKEETRNDRGEIKLHYSPNFIQVK